jgi:hypothetical protein
MESVWRCTTRQDGSLALVEAYAQGRETGRTAAALRTRCRFEQLFDSREECIGRVLPVIKPGSDLNMAEPAPGATTRSPLMRFEDAAANSANSTTSRDLESQHEDAQRSWLRPPMRGHAIETGVNRQAINV